MQSAIVFYQFSLSLYPMLVLLFTSQTDVIWLTTGRRMHQLPQQPLPVGSDLITQVLVVRDLGIYLDADASMRSHIMRTTSGNVQYNDMATLQNHVIGSSVLLGSLLRRIKSCGVMVSFVKHSALRHLWLGDKKGIWSASAISKGSSLVLWRPLRDLA